MEGQLLVYPLYYKFSERDIPENIRRCEETSCQCGAGCVFRIVGHTNYHLSSIFTDNGYGLEKCGVVGECSLTGDAGKLCMKEKVQGELFLKNRNGGTEYVMAGEMVVGIKRQGLLFLPDGNLPDTGLEDILQFAAANGIVKILADIPGGGRTARAVWVAGLLQSLSLPMLSERRGGEILQRTGGLKDGFTE